jgi:proteasome accessory factor B
MGRTKQNKGTATTTFNTQPQLLRLHKIVQRIQKGDYPNQKVLATELDKNWRTIQRDLDFIRDMWELPLEYDPKRYGYYFREAVGKFPMVQISERELVSVFMAQKVLAQHRGTPFERPLQSAFEKLVSGMEGEISVAWKDLDSAISFRGIEANMEDAELLQTLGNAVRGRTEIEFVYHKLEGGVEGRGSSVESVGKAGAVKSPRQSERESSEENRGRSPGGEQRRVRPYHLGMVGGQWYLFAYDPMRKDIRRFVPARMQEVKVLAETKFERPASFSVEKILKGSFGVYSGGSKLMTMKIRFDRFAGQRVKEK